MSSKRNMSGNEAVAFAMKQINPDVVPAFPITPSTEIPMMFSSYAADGLVDTEFIPVESEHSAMSACIGSEAAGARTMSATSANGLALMWEMLYIASSFRLPITLCCVNRALSGPININNDHGDSMGARDAGWIQLYSENNQEAYDNIIQAIRIGEHPDVRLPVMVCQDGFITSHSVENMELMEDAEVRKFTGTYNPEFSLLGDVPIAMGPYESADYYIEHKRQQAEGINRALSVVKEIAAEYEQISGRAYETIEAFEMEDAEYALIVIGSTAGTAKAAIRELRAEGSKVGLVKIRLFRPFPEADIVQALGDVKGVAVMDKAEGFSANGGPLFADVCTALYRHGKHCCARNFVYGLGGRDVKTDDIMYVFREIARETESGTEGGSAGAGAGAVAEPYRYLGVRE
jgi:pyruvate ferredoxin oxidoreductase alpha subunit